VRTNADCLRSLKKYVSLGLDHLTGQTWTVRLAHESPDRGDPVAVVSSVGPSTSTAVRPGLAELSKRYHVACRLLRSSSAEAATLEGEVLADHLGDLFTFGLDRGRPHRVPLYVYGDAAFDSPSEQRDPHDFARVVDVSTRARIESDDLHRALVVAEVELQWRKVTRSTPGRPVEGVAVEATGR